MRPWMPLASRSRWRTNINRAALRAWYAANRRDMPWRRTRDPYSVWVSEVMLQQTQVATVLPYYERWMSRFPSFDVFAGSDEQQALAVWQGLGYYRRCRMLLEGARWVMANGVPSSAAGWLQVPGVGRYTAAAIASICFNEASAVVDGNVERVFARFTGCSLSGSALNRAAWKWAPGQIPAEQPGDWNQAMMELGARVCTPRTPKCPACPLQCDCVAFNTGRVPELPVVVPRSKAIAIEGHAFVEIGAGRVRLEQIPDGEWSQGMWRLPACAAGASRQIGTVKHTVTRHRVELRVHLIESAKGRVRELRANCGSGRWVSLEDIEEIPMPAPQRRALAMAMEALQD